MAAPMRGKLTITTADVARRAGLSKMTVSRVLNGHPHVSAKTRKKVLDIVGEMGFTPNTLAKRFFTGKTQLIGLIMPFEYMFSSFYFKDLFRGVHAALEEQDYELLIHDSMSAKSPAVDKARDLVRGRLVEGLLVAAPMSFDDYPYRLSQEGIPLVVVGETAHAKKVHRVGIPNRAGSADAVGRLVALGHRRIAILTYDGEHMEAGQRARGYQDALQRAGLAQDPRLVGKGRYRRHQAFEETRRLMQESKDITAIFATNADMALGAAEALRSLKLSIPGDVSLVAFDDCPDLEMWNPPISSVRQYPYKVGYEATQMLLELVRAKGPGTPRQQMIGTDFIERDSMAPPRTRRERKTP
ncbi:MAG: LacI family DNA-binding transcriptional regulator [Kiritimatiellae bacterium]|nr:LacI family DNA-binding transcriptional regulator [Kiritimatiellia bacterium]